MKAETIEKIFKFLEKKEGKEVPNMWSFIYKIETHPDGVQYRYKYDLYLGYSNIRKLPNDLYVDGFLSLSNCSQLTKLPDKLHVEGKLNLSGCKQLTELPDNLYVKDSLVLYETNITELPNNLYVGRNLDIYKASLAKNYTDDEIIKMITSKGGKINGRIIRHF
jgi:hypothetical protein